MNDDGGMQQATQNVQNAFPQAQPVNQGYQQNSQSQQSSGYERQAGPPPGQGAPGCQHGTREWVTGRSKSNGKPWKMWACPADREDPSKCEPVWVR